MRWLLLAAGSSSRFGRNKLLEKIGDRRLIDLTIGALMKTNIPITLISPPKLRDTITWTGDWAAGGARRQDSAFEGIKSCDNEIILIHDAARPFVTKAIVDDCLREIDNFDGVAPALPVTDTIKRVDGSRVIETLERSTLVAMQTPQVVRRTAALDAFARATREYTDDLAVLEAAGYRTGIVPGDRGNVKITTPDDIVNR